MVYRTASDKEKQSFSKLKDELIRQFQPVRIRAIQSNLFRKRKQQHGEKVGDYYRSLRELYRRAFPIWAQKNDPDGEEILRTSFLGGLRSEVQRCLTVEDQELSLKSLFTRAQYVEATLAEVSREQVSKSDRGYRQSSHPSSSTEGWSTQGDKTSNIHKSQKHVTTVESLVT